MTISFLVGFGLTVGLALALALAVSLVVVVVDLLVVEEGVLEGREEFFFSRRSLEMRSWMALGVAPGGAGGVRVRVGGGGKNQGGGERRVGKGSVVGLRGTGGSKTGERGKMR